MTVIETTCEVPIFALGIGQEVHAQLPTELCEADDLFTYADTEYSDSFSWVLAATGEPFHNEITRQIRVEEAVACLWSLKKLSDALELARQLPPFPISINRMLTILPHTPAVYDCAKEVAAKADDNNVMEELFTLITAYEEYDNRHAVAARS